jgi:hypothetical protein
VLDSRDRLLDSSFGRVGLPRHMGVFTIYDWGNGAAAEAAMRVLDHHGPLEVRESPARRR